MSDGICFIKSFICFFSLENLLAQKLLLYVIGGRWEMVIFHQDSAPAQRARKIIEIWW